MPTPTKGPRLGGGSSHERLILANLATALFEHGHITTTLAKAKRLRPVAERLVTKAKRGDLHCASAGDDRRPRQDRRARSVHRDRPALPRTEPGGYTRIVKLGPRKGDNAPMAVIELVEAAGRASRGRGNRGDSPGRQGADGNEACCKGESRLPSSKLSTPRRKRPQKPPRTPKPRVTSRAPHSRRPKQTKRRRRPKS